MLMQCFQASGNSASFRTADGKHRVDLTSAEGKGLDADSVGKDFDVDVSVAPHVEPAPEPEPVPEQPL